MMSRFPTTNQIIKACFTLLGSGLLLLMTVNCARKTTPIAFDINALLMPDSLLILPIISGNEPTDHVLPPDSICHIAGPIVLEATHWEGYVGFRPAAGLWYIAHSPYQPGEGGDAIQNGFVCHLPTAYKKAGLRVYFSGHYYHAWKYITRETAGETVLYLDLTAIQAG